MNITLEKIDSLRERANVSYAEAKEALEQNEGNMIDAIIYLEQENKTVYDRAKREEHRSRERVRQTARKEKCKTNADDFVEISKKVVNSLNETRVVMYNDDRVVFDISATIALIATAFLFPFTASVFVLGLLLGNRFKIVRKDKKSDALNSVLNKAADLTKNVSDSLKDKVNDVQVKEESKKEEVFE